MDTLLRDICAFEDLPECIPGEETPMESEEDDEDTIVYRPAFADDVPLSTVLKSSTQNESSDDVDAALSTFTEPHARQEGQRRWKKKDNSTTLPQFTEKEGYNADEFVNSDTPTEVFFKYFDKDIREKIVFETNLYAVQKGRNFQPITDRELLGFIGINFMMGYHQLPALHHYWSCHPDLHVSPISETMPRTCFTDILSNLHLNNNMEMPDNNQDRVYKLRPLIDGMNERFAFLYNMKKQQSIDESIILLKGRSSLKQYNLMKPIKQGYKLWCRADITGYIGQFERD